MSKGNKKVQLPYTHYEEQMVYKLHHFYLSRIIGPPELYIPMIHTIQTAGENDTIHIHLNTAGGTMDTGLQLINAMKASSAHIICSLEAKSHSLGTLIFLAADEFIVHDNCAMMFHNYSSGTAGKGHEQLAEVAATHKWYADLTRKFYIPFLTESEYTNILNGSDLWMGSDEIRDRLTAMVDNLQQQEANTKKKKKKSKKGE